MGAEVTAPCSYGRLYGQKWLLQYNRGVEAMMHEMYVIQGINGGFISEEWSVDDEGLAMREVDKLLKSLTFEGDRVRIITRDGELVWDSVSESLTG